MFLSNKEIRALNEQIKLEFDLDKFFSSKDRVEKKKKESKKDSDTNLSNVEILFRNNEPVFFYFENRLFPHLKLLQADNFVKKVIVDMPAIPYMIKGADVMRPGIKEIDEGILKDSFVAVVDENNKKAIAVGIALFDSDEMRKMVKGKVIKNIHFVGDKVWD